MWVGNCTKVLFAQRKIPFLRSSCHEMPLFSPFKSMNCHMHYSRFLRAHWFGVFVVSPPHQVSYWIALSPKMLCVQAQPEDDKASHTPFEMETYQLVFCKPFYKPIMHPLVINSNPCGWDSQFSLRWILPLGWKLPLGHLFADGKVWKPYEWCCTSLIMPKMFGCKSECPHHLL